MEIWHLYYWLFHLTTDGKAGCPVVVVRRVDIANVVEEEAARAVVIRRTGPPETVAADTVEAATAVAQTTRGRIPDSGGGAKLAIEVHTLIGVIIGI